MGTSGLGSFMALAIVFDVVSCFTVVVVVDVDDVVDSDIFVVTDAMVDCKHYSHK